MVEVFLLLLGLTLGSFVNAFVWRLHKKLDFVNSRSKCIHCDKQLAWYDLVPVISWVYLRGKCRYCKSDISIQYPAVELLTAFLFIVSFTYWPQSFASTLNTLEFSSWLVMLTGLIALAVFDIKWFILPNVLVYPLIALALVTKLSVSYFTEGLQAGVIATGGGIFVGAGLFYLLYAVSNGKWIGGGDVKLGILLGIILGPKSAAVALAIAFILGSLVSLPLLMFKIVSRKQKLPFGPFLILGIIIARLAGDKIANWYLSNFYL